VNAAAKLQRVGPQQANPTTNAMRIAVLVGGAALVLTLASSLISDTRLEVQDWDCPPAPASCARPVVVAGYPLPYISDYHAISPVGSASLDGAVWGLDLFHAMPFVADFGIYVILALAVVAGSRALDARRRRARENTGEPAA
jgi:hypothetical protein